METIYRKVAVSERMPDISKWNIDYFILEFDPPRKGRFIQGFVANGLFIDTHRDGYSTVNIPFNPQPTHYIEEIPDTTTQLQADKAELLEALENLTEYGSTGEDAVEMKREIESLIQKMKKCQENTPR